jgi:hypothetical protein
MGYVTGVAGKNQTSSILGNTLLMAFGRQVNGVYRLLV